MKVWLVTVVLLFVALQLFEAIKGFILPLPIYVLAGAFLAIVSNYNKGVDDIFKNSSHPVISQNATVENDLALLNGVEENPKN
ncbi:MAG: hypothetical protein N5P05_002570 [Chroococcopsis gigantea SAG 12.99]|jgi:hypothetical protein|nr:hypothetical protein [Chlorogloea purpurea SAG 13.99]MDV3000964.1 hypothetical protein [Chroococcopsis gigantea SAG 12.99]